MLHRSTPVLLALLPACAVTRPAEPHDPEAVREELARTYREMTADMERGSATYVTDMYAEDAILFPADGPPVRGKASLAEMFARTKDAPVVLESEPLEVGVFGDVAVERGEFWWRRPDGEVGPRTTYFMVWRFDEGRWRIVRDIVQGRAGE